MPQLNFADYEPQLVWLAITFILLYLMMRRWALPKVARVLDERERRIKGDLERAERLKAEADEALAAYRRTLADARGKAQAELREAAAAVAAEIAKRDAAFAASVAERTRAAERRIAEAKRAGLVEMRTVAAEIAEAMTAKLAGVAPRPEDIRAAVDAAISERS
jgi:F-type H+-transporting ATPase subunit b